MELQKFEAFVKEHKLWLKGPTVVSEDLILEAEQQLGLRFPHEFHWLLTRYGIWNGTGLQAIQWIVASTLRLNIPNIVVLAQTTLSQFDAWNGVEQTQQQPKVCGYLLWEFNNGRPGRLYWLRESAHHDIRDYYNYQFKNIAHIVFEDFTDYIVKRVNRLKGIAKDGYEECPYDKPLPETPLVVNQEEFPWLLFLDKLGETISWNMVRAKFPINLPDDFQHEQQPNWIDELVYVQETRRHLLLSGGHKADSYYAMIGSSCRPIIRPAQNLAGGDLLLTSMQEQPSEKIHEQLSYPVNNRIIPHILDPWGRPAPDYWVCQFLLSSNDEQTDSQQYLVSWIPPGMYPQTERELKQGNHTSSCWLTHSPEILRHHFQDRHLIAV